MKIKSKWNIIGIVLIAITIINMPVSIYFAARPTTPRLTPEIIQSGGREAKIGTYVYDHTRVANDTRYLDDISDLADRVLIDVSWSKVMKNDTVSPFETSQFLFYDDFLNNLSIRGLEIVIQFSPTRGPPSWLDITFEMDSYRVVRPPTDPTDFDHFETQLMRYVNYTVDYFKNKPYLVSPIEWCLADEPNTADWKPILQSMYDGIKARDPTSRVSVVEHKKELYTAFDGTYDMFTIDPYGSDQDVEEKIRLAYSATNEEKPVRVIISGMARDHDYYLIRKQVVLSWFMGAYDVWYWSYNSRWDGLTNEWYVVKYSTEGPIYTQRAEAVIEAKEDLARFGLIEEAINNDGISTSIRTELSNLEQDAYRAIMNLRFDDAENILEEAIGLIP